jgi:subtilisin family serine protease
MYLLSGGGVGPVELELIEERPLADAADTALEHAAGRASLRPTIAQATHAFFLNGRVVSYAIACPAPNPVPFALRTQSQAKAAEPVAVFRERRSGLVRTVKRELVLRFRLGTSQRRRRMILRAYGLAPRRRSETVAEQFVVRHKQRGCAGAALVELANRLAEEDEVVFATPNFVSQYRRTAASAPAEEQWHLWNRAAAPGQRLGEDVRAVEAWRTTPGKRSIIVAVLDDGVDVDHPDLKAQIRRKKSGPDTIGRDFFLATDHPDHYNPRPKQFGYPFWDLANNDIHGTACAGVVGAAGKGAYGVAYRCKLLPVKVLHADAYASDERIAEAIRYAAHDADVMSISWTGPSSPDIQAALRDESLAGRRGRGVAAFCCTGNDGLTPVSLPAGFEGTIAVGASTDKGTIAPYSNTGPEVDVVAPSSGGVKSVFTTDVSAPGRGFNGGGTLDALYTDQFTGTSAATPMVAGVAALMLSANPELDRESVRGILHETADKIGRGYDTSGHSHAFGYGRVNAQRAVEAAANGRRAPRRRG